MKCACDAHAIQKQMLSPLGAIFSLVRRRPLKIIRALLEVATIAVVGGGFCLWIAWRTQKLLYLAAASVLD
jgi:hypothetical protein